MLELCIGAAIGLTASLLKALYTSRNNQRRNRFGRIKCKEFILANPKKERLSKPDQGDESIDRRLIPINIELSDGKKIQYEVPTMNTLIYMLESHEGIGPCDPDLLIPRILEIRELNQLMILNGPTDYIRKTIIGCAEHNSKMKLRFLD